MDILVTYRHWGFVIHNNTIQCTCYFDTEKGSSSKLPSPSTVIENLRITLTTYRRKLDESINEVRKPFQKIYHVVYELAETKIHIIHVIL